jgi:hypothetical protein
MPNALPTENSPDRFNIGPFQFEGMTLVANPFWSELPRFAARTTLDTQPVLAKSFPISFR